MKQHSFLAHTPKELRRLSNPAHIIEGALITTVGLLALLGNMRTFQWTSTVWPLLILVAGIVLLFLLHPPHPMSEWSLIWGDAQQREHTIIAAAVAIAGVAELLRSTIQLLRYAWPAAVILAGLLNFVQITGGATLAAIL